MAIRLPMPISFKLTFNGNNISLREKTNIKKRLTTVNSILYHTNKPSFREINRPNTPVKPHKNTAICSLYNADFMGE